MPLQSAMVYVLLMALVAASPVMAQSRQTDPERWHAFAEQLPPNALVTVHLTSGERVKGHVVQVTADALHLNPKTRMAVPVREFAFDTIKSIDREKEGMSTGAKVAIWAAVIGAGAIIITYVLVAELVGD